METQEQRIVSDIAFTPAVKAVQVQLGSREIYATSAKRGGWTTTITPDLAAFIAARDSFYLGTASAAGQPYIQHRGGPKGFLKVFDECHLAFADYAGNLQYISMGNLSENDKAYIFLMDYPNRTRIKMWGRARVVEDDAELLERVRDTDYSARPERVFLFELEAWDRNCPQHIQPRYTEGEIQGRVRVLEERVRHLESENVRLRRGNKRA